MIGSTGDRGGLDNAVASVTRTGSPMTYCKEQVPTEYASRLAEMGYAALVFDPRYRGESAGEPRCWEDPAAKVADISSAVAYLEGRSDVDSARSAGLSVCQGGSEMLLAAADDDRIKVVATVAGHYRDHEGDIAWLTDDGYHRHLQDGAAAKQN